MCSLPVIEFAIYWPVASVLIMLSTTRVLSQENETAIEFAARVKADICRKGGLVDLPW